MRWCLRNARLYELEKAYKRVDREALWNILKMYGVGGQVMEGIIAFYRETNAYVMMDGELSDNFINT